MLSQSLHGPNSNTRLGENASHTSAVRHRLYSHGMLHNTPRVIHRNSTRICTNLHLHDMPRSGINSPGHEVKPRPIGSRSRVCPPLRFLTVNLLLRHSKLLLVKSGQPVVRSGQPVVKSGQPVVKTQAQVIHLLGKGISCFIKRHLPLFERGSQLAQPLCLLIIGNLLSIYAEGIYLLDRGNDITTVHDPSLGRPSFVFTRTPSRLGNRYQTRGSCSIIAKGGPMRQLLLF